MEFRDSGAEVAGGPNLFKNRLPLIIGGLVALAVIGLLVLLLFVFGVLPPGRHTAATTAQPTATRVAIAQATNANTPAAPAQQTSNAASTSATPAPENTPVVVTTMAAPAATTAAPKSGAPAAPVANAPSNPFRGLYVTGLRVIPDNPRKNDPIAFSISFSNQTGQDQHYNVCVEAFRPGDKKSFGMTYCPRQTIPSGQGQVVTGEWTVTGIRECLPVRARPVVKDEGEIRIPLQQTNGAELWINFQVCP